jgi:signal peptidase
MRTTAHWRRGVLLPAAVLGLVVLVPLAVLMGTVLLLGWQLQVIETGSMAPRIATGSLAVVEPIDAADVGLGMVIVFEDPSDRGRLIAHRAVARLPGERPVWQTQGDANARPDAYPVHAAAIEGRVRWTIPRLGSIASALHTPITAVLLVGVPLLVLVVSEIVVLGRRRRAQADGASASQPETVRIYAVHDISATTDQTTAGFIDVFSRRADAERFISGQPATDQQFLVIERDLALNEETPS